MIAAQEIRAARACIKRDRVCYTDKPHDTSRKAPRINDTQRAWLKLNAPDYTAKDAAAHLGCAINTVRAQARKLGVTLKAGVPHNHGKRFQQHPQDPQA